MTDPITDARWKEYDQLGEENVRKNLAKQIYGEDRQKLAREWLAHQESLRTSARDEDASDLTRQANSLASSANDIAVRALNASQTNNMIATAALIAAVIAIAISIIGIFIK